MKNNPYTRQTFLSDVDSGRSIDEVQENGKTRKRKFQAHVALRNGFFCCCLFWIARIEWRDMRVVVKFRFGNVARKSFHVLFEFSGSANMLTQP